LAQESVQRRFSRFIGSLGSMTYAERLNILNADSLEVCRLKFDPVMIYCSVHGLNAFDFSDFFNTSNSSTRGHVFKLSKHFTVLTAVLLVLLIVLLMCGTV